VVIANVVANEVGEQPGRPGVGAQGGGRLAVQLRGVGFGRLIDGDWPELGRLDLWRHRLRR
jgi:hypothetical protein